MTLALAFKVSGAVVLVLAAGLSVSGFFPKFPWFAPLIAGIVLFTFGMTFDDAEANDRQMRAEAERPGEAEL